MCIVFNLGKFLRSQSWSFSCPPAFAKKSLYSLFQATGANWLLRTASRSQLLVLNYHGVVSEEFVQNDLMESVASFTHRNAISVQRFREQLQTLLRHFTPVAAGDVLDWLSGKGRLPSNPVLVTFDDGFRNNATMAAPELERLGVPAVFHVATGYVGTGRTLWPLELDHMIITWPLETLPLPSGKESIALPTSSVERCEICDKVRKQCKSISNHQRTKYLESLRSVSGPNGDGRDRDLNDFMTWDDVRSLVRKGFSIGSHSVEHPILTQLESEELSRELVDSKQTIEREIESECVILAYPNGGPDDFSPSVVQAAEDAGYRLAFTLIRGFNNLDTPPLQFHRINISADINLAEFQAMASGLYTILKGRS